MGKVFLHESHTKNQGAISQDGRPGSRAMAKSRPSAVAVCWQPGSAVYFSSAAPARTTGSRPVMIRAAIISSLVKFISDIHFPAGK